MPSIAVIILFVIALVVVGAIAAKRTHDARKNSPSPSPAPTDSTVSTSTASTASTTPDRLPNPPGLKAETYLQRAEDKRSAMRLYRTYDFK